MTFEVVQTVRSCCKYLGASLQISSIYVGKQIDAFTQSQTIGAQSQP